MPSPFDGGKEDDVESRDWIPDVGTGSANVKYRLSGSRVTVDASEDLAEMIVNIASGKIPASSCGIIADIVALGRLLLQETAYPRTREKREDRS